VAVNMPVIGIIVPKWEGLEIAPAYSLLGALELGDERREPPPLVHDVLSLGAAEQPEGDAAAGEASEARSPHAARPRR
jgi:hypothetical protein